MENNPIIHINATPEFFKDKKAVGALKELVKLAYNMEQKKECIEWCGMNHCDTNGCSERERHLVVTDLINNPKLSGTPTTETVAIGIVNNPGGGIVNIEPQIPLSKAFKFAEWTKNQGWGSNFFVGQNTKDWYNIFSSNIEGKTTSELFTLFEESNKEK